jgi:Ca-activated chloride channel family protein
MSRLVPVGPRARRARSLAALLVGGLCLSLTACGGGSSSGKAAGYAGGMPVAHPEAPAPGGFDKLQQEAYAPIVENPFRSPLVEPRSTFSADVNTAAYSNVRRFLNSGQLPPRDAVFLADFVNYFPYRYPQPKGDDPVSLTVELAPCPWKPEHHLARIGVRARSHDPGEAPRRNLVFLIDVSGSMESPTRLPLVKQSLDLLVDQLSPADRVSVVTYADGTAVRLRPTPGDQKGAHPRGRSLATGQRRHRR